MTEPGWISLKCSWCQTKFRIREEYAHLKGKCPECGTRVPPVKHKPFAPLPAFSEAEEPAGLVPLEDDEWPEPAQREHEGAEVAGLQYGFAAVAPAPAAATPPPAPEMIIPLAAEKPAPPPPLPPTPVPTTRGTEDTFQPAPSRPAPPRTEPAPPPKPAPSKAIDPLFLEEIPTLAPEPLPPAPVQNVETPPVPPSTAVGQDLFSFAEPPGTTNGTPNEAPVISPYSFRETEPAPPAPPPLAKFPPPDYVLPADGEKSAKPKRKKEKAPASAGPDSPSPSSNEPSKDLDSYRLTQAELNPERAVPPPDQLFLFGVWDWPFHPVNLKALLAIAVGAMLLLFFSAEAVGQFSSPNQSLGFVFGSAMVFMCLVVVALFGSYASAWFLAILNDTANGSREVTFPGGGIPDWLGALLRIAWIGFLSAIITLPLGVIWWGLWGLGALLLFPVFLLCSLASDWSWSPWHPDIAWNIARKLKLYCTMNFLAVLAWGLVGTLIWATSTSNWLLCPIGGLACAAAWLIYARLLGRFGWVVLNPDEEAGPKKKKKKKRKKNDTANGEAEPTAAEGSTSSLVAANEP